jgi:hypothetical protein
MCCRVFDFIFISGVDHEVADTIKGFLDRFSSDPFNFISENFHQGFLPAAIALMHPCY